MGKLASSQPLRSKRKVQQVTVRTPEQDLADSDLLDLQSSYFSICYLLQSENEVSSKLVAENNVLPQILEKLTNGCPRDIEQLSLNALASALSWAPPEALSPLLQQGLLDFCWGVLQRSTGSRGAADPTGDTALELLRDIVYLDERVAQWVLDQMDTVLSILTSSPNISLRRGCARLIYALVEGSPGAFVPGLPASRLSRESMQVIFSQLACSDVETCCFITMSGLLLEELYGSAVVPAVANMKLDLCAMMRDILVDCVSFTAQPTEQEEFRMSQFRSRLRGASSMLELLADTVAETLDDKIASVDSIEDRKFFLASGVESQAIVVSQQLLIGMDSSSILACIGKFASQLISAGKDVDDNEDVSDSTANDPHTLSTILDDQDVKNVFELVSQWARIDKYTRFRFGGDLAGLNGMIYFSCQVLSMDAVDLALGSVLVSECCDWLCTLLKRTLIIGGGSTLDQNMIADVLTGVSRILGLMTSPIDHPATIESCMEILQLVYLLYPSQVELRGKCAEMLVGFLAKLDQPNMVLADDEYVSSICSAVECVFVVFGENDLNAYLRQWDWISFFRRVADALRFSVKAGNPKAQRNERAEYVLGTAENMAAFIQYKQGQ